MESHLVIAISDINEKQALALARQMLDAGIPPIQILIDCRAAVKRAAQRFASGEYSVAEMILTTEMVRAIGAEARPHLNGTVVTARAARVVLGTVKGDIHEIGKDLVALTLRAEGFEVYDLGTDVQPEDFVAKIAEDKPQVVALSGFLSTAIDSMKETITAIRDAGLRERVKIMVGGCGVRPQACDYVRADAYGTDALAAVNLARQWTRRTAARQVRGPRPSLYRLLRRHARQIQQVRIQWFLFADYLSQRRGNHFALDLPHQHSEPPVGNGLRGACPQPGRQEAISSGGRTSSLDVPERRHAQLEPSRSLCF